MTRWIARLWRGAAPAAAPQLLDEPTAPETGASLRATLTSAARTVAQLRSAVDRLTARAADQASAIGYQSGRLRQLAQGAGQIKRAASLASNKAQAVLDVASNAEQASAAGQESAEASLTSIREISAQVDSIVNQIANLATHVRQVGQILETVKDIADQSEVLAVNAGIQAVKAGEYGRGFDVVAREMRSLSDQSRASTEKVRRILADVTKSLRSTVLITQQGQEKIAQSMDQIRASSEYLRQLTEIVQLSNRETREIATSVRNQNQVVQQVTASLLTLQFTMSDLHSACQDVGTVSREIDELTTQVSEELSADRPDEGPPPEDTDEVPPPAAD